MDLNLFKKVNLEDLVNKLGYKFQDKELLIQALCHASFVNEHSQAHLADNERLEFLGDAVLDLAVSHILMDLFRDAEEGVLSKYRAMIVDELGLYKVAKLIGLGEYIFLGKGEEQSGGREKTSILADAMEAVLGAIYLDGGFNNALAVIKRLFSISFQELGTKDSIHDFKSSLQEYTQRKFKTVPSYKLVQEWGPAHDRTFKVALKLNGKLLAEAEGKSKKEAEQKAARIAFSILRGE